MAETCTWCHQPLRWAGHRRGWVHEEGGLYMMRCPECDWQGAPHPSPTSCPQCGSLKLRDDHCALPDLSESKKFAYYY